MVTVRTYWNRDRAVLEKTLLEDYGVSCALIHENANNFYPLAMPIRLLVTDDQADRAIRILDGNLEDVDQVNEDAEEISLAPSGGDNNRNPWELLVLAFYLLLPAICLIATKFPAHVAGRYGRYYVARATIAQFLSWLAVIAALLLIGLYFAVRRSARRQPMSNQDQI